MPEVVNAPTSYLVVDGFINGNGVTRIKLSRTENVAATTTPPVEKGATIYITDNTGSRYPLSEKTSGSYQSDSLTLPAGRQYQLRITTSGKVSYESNLVPLKITPPIDKLSFQLADEQVQLLLSTHDASAQSRYYRWNLVETWEFNAAYQSLLEYYPNPKPGQKRLDNRTTPIYTCWRTERATSIMQGTSSQLSQDALTNALVARFSRRAERVKIRYSALISQYVETPEEFAYFEILRKNTEAVGTINDPLPVQLTGNVHRVGRPEEPVLGFVGAHTVQSQRLFIDHTELPPLDASVYLTPYTTCRVGIAYFCDTQGNCDVEGVIDLFRLHGNIPLYQASDPDYGAGIASASTECADCRVRGTTSKPTFW
jgi:hypothetical protein